MFEGHSSLFVRDADRFVPTPLARGPWSASALHGGPPAALLAQAIEQFEVDEPMFVSRITLELLRPVPLAPLRLSTRWLRPGRKVQLVEASLHSDTHEVARASGLRIRMQDLQLPEGLPMEPVTVASPDRGAALLPDKLGAFLPGFHSHGVEHRFVHGEMSVPGPATDWIRLKVPLLAGEETSPLSRVCAAADFGNGVSQILPPSHTFINPDLTVYLHRYPVGEWVCIDSVTRVEAHGVGLAESRLLDLTGSIGRSLQGLIIEERR
jgi:acyl-coenzyme A thioesterase PaaI-like protein